MGHATTRFDFHRIAAAGPSKAPGTWLTRLHLALVAKLLSDQPPLAAARAYSYATRALPVPTT
jgi:hypothetical protein